MRDAASLVTMSKKERYVHGFFRDFVFVLLFCFVHSFSSSRRSIGGGETGSCRPSCVGGGRRSANGYRRGWYHGCDWLSGGGCDGRCGTRA